MPCRCDDVWRGFRGVVRFIRAFGIPRKLDDYERVWLTFAGMTGCADVRLNGEALGNWEATAFEIDVTDRLCPRNVLDVHLICTEPGTGFLAPVAPPVPFPSS